MDDVSVMPAELTVSQLYVLPQNARSSDSLQLGAEARNDGGSESGPFKVRLSLDTGEWQDIEWPSLAPGQSQWREWDHVPLVAGYHTLSVELDVDNQVQEGNKSDNRASIPFQVAEAAASPQFATQASEAFASTKVIDMEPEVIETSGPKHAGKGNNAATEVDWILNRFINYIDGYWTHYRDGINLFTNQMQFPSDEEAEADSLNAALIAGAGELFVKGMEHIVEDVPGLGAVVSAMDKAGEAYVKSEEAKRAARGRIKIHTYITDLINEIQGQAEPMKKRVEQERPNLTDLLYEKIKASDEVVVSMHGRPSSETGYFYGEAADLIRKMEEKAAAFESSTPTADQFFQQFTLRFIRSEDSGKSVRKTFGASRQAGTFRMNVKFKSQDDSWVLDDVPDHWTFLTTTPEADKLADELQDVLGKGQQPWQILDTLITMYYDDEHVLLSLGNGPLDVSFSNASNNKVADWADGSWKAPGIRDRVLGVKKVQAGDDYEFH